MYTCTHTHRLTHEHTPRGHILPFRAKRQKKLRYQGSPRRALGRFRTHYPTANSMRTTYIVYYAYIQICMYTFTHMCMYIHVYKYYKCVNIGILGRFRIHVSTANMMRTTYDVCVYVNYANIRIHVHTYTHRYMYKYVYTYTYTNVCISVRTE